MKTVAEKEAANFDRDLDIELTEDANNELEKLDKDPDYKLTNQTKLEM